jgi:tRNA-2-methylthio-N6-dimethylallyladenosine synthase
MDATPVFAHPEVRPRKAWVETYGCQMNVSDGELMQGILAANGFALAATPEEADVILVNTCAIREHAEQRVLGRVGELNRIKRERPDVVIGVTGCMAQRMGQTLLERAPYVELVMGPDGYRLLPDVLARLRGSAGLTPTVSPAPEARRSLPVLAAGDDVASLQSAAPATSPDRDRRGNRLAVLEFSADENYEGLEVRRTSGVSAWIPIQRGCNYRCTYCIVPYVRGSEKNREPARILEEVRGVAQRGITEVVLLGQTVNSWNHDGWTFARLLREVARIDGIRRVRFTSPHPADLTPDVIEVMATEPAVCKQLHLPVQSGHDRTLKRMLRRYTVAGYRDLVRRVRDAMPGLALSTDIIVAFPGETDAEYEATLDLVREIRYDDAFLYRYSARDGTPSTRLPAEQTVPAAVAQARLERLIELQRGIQAEINAAEVGREVELLVEREGRFHGDMLGRTETYKVATFPGDALLAGRYVKVLLTGTTGATFRAVRNPSQPVDRVA